MVNSKMIHPSHPEHPLEMVNHQESYTCDGCKMEGTGPRYRCERCNYDLHHECMFAPSKLKFQAHTCKFYESPLPAANCTKVNCTKCIRSCDACGLTIKGFVYHYSEKGWDFHPRCAKLENKIQVGNVTFWLKKQGPCSCAWCKKKLPRGAGKNNIPGWSYVSKYDDYNFHEYCVMEMAMQNSYTPSNYSATTSRDSSSALVMHQGINLPLKIKSKRSGANSIKWVEILKIFLRTVFSILFGDPSAILASTMAHLVTQGLFHQG